MHSYLEETKYASSELIKLISYEEKELTELRLQVREKEKELSRRYLLFRQKDFDMNDEMHLQHAYGKFFSFGESIVYPLKNSLEEMESRLITKNFSIGALSGALLQIAKQGISTVYVGLQDCPDGRAIGNQALKNVIWRARNQSIHYEMGSYHPPVQVCFQQLEADFGSKYHLSDKNLSKEIIDLLGWTEYAQYEKDMIHLLG
ncbi:hypothetical protein [Salipaludibacillus sp. CF4.18]|uniref:hypothetical protein n=1 Tax=Salipaludibacillus sp. CF4.18 TaxID=3373081 RepID=UPI003EE6ED85